MLAPPGGSTPLPTGNPASTPTMVEQHQNDVKTYLEKEQGQVLCQKKFWINSNTRKYTNRYVHWKLLNTVKASFISIKK